MRIMLANILPWAGYRKTYGESIARRELAGHIVAHGAFTEWCANLPDMGYSR